MSEKIGSTILYKNPPSIKSYAAIGGKRESEGPLGNFFDFCNKDTMFGQKTWEQAETKLLATAAKYCIDKSDVNIQEIDYALSGDLQSQCAASNYALRGLGIPMIGLYGACSTMAEGLGLASVIINSGVAKNVIAMTSSHYCSAEREFRFPLEYGGKRAPTSQWTATAAGCVMVEPNNEGPFVKGVTFGRVQDYGIKDINNMGAAMAPAAADTLLEFFKDTGTKPADYDRIFTGDLGAVGSILLEQLCEQRGVPLTNHSDCGLMLYDRKKQEVGAGGSGAGCSASVLCGHILPKLKNDIYKKVLFIATGALMSPTTFLQKESIPGIAHLIYLTSK